MMSDAQRGCKRKKYDPGMLVCIQCTWICFVFQNFYGVTLKSGNSGNEWEQTGMTGKSSQGKTWYTMSVMRCKVTIKAINIATNFLFFILLTGWSADGTRPYNPPFRGRVFWILLHLFYMGNMRIHENGQREGRI